MIKSYEESPRNKLTIVKNIYGKYNFSINKIDNRFEDEEISATLTKKQVEQIIKDLNKSLEDK